MNNNALVERDLHHLVPTYAGPLPPELLSLASSLLAQSRTRISNLKPNEEIARSYACAHIACERLKNTLDLPSIDPNPPLPKRPYNTLLSQIRNALPEANDKKKRNLPSTASATGTSTAGGALPTEVQESIHNLCQRLATPNAEQYIVAGVSTVLPTLSFSSSPAKKGRALAKERADKTTAIIAAATLLVIERLAPFGTYTNVGSIRWKRDVGFSAKVQEVLIALGTDGTDRAMRTAARDWVNQFAAAKDPFIKGVPSCVGVKDSDEEGGAEGASKRKREGEESGIGSMMQERVDYLSERRKRNYREWEKMILEKAKEVERKRKG